MTRNTQAWNAVIAVLLVLAMIAYGYGVAGYAGGAIEVNAGRTPPAQGIAVFVEDNGVHTGIVLPKAALAGALDAVLDPRAIRDPRYAAHEWVAIGWGDRAFYQETPTWNDVRPATVAAALIGSDRTVLHVEHVGLPVAGPSVRRVLLRPQEFARLIGFVRASIGSGAPVAGYGAHDAFYPARGRYSAVVTCNEWTGAALRRAGVPMGAWTPFAGRVMQWL